MKISCLKSVSNFAVFMTVMAIVINSILAISLAADSAEPKQETPLKAGFICVGPVNDWGYNQAHNQGRLFLEHKMPGQVVTTIAENIPENAEAERVMEKMIAAGNRMIFSTSYGHYEPALRVAARHPDVIFAQCGRMDPATRNLSTYFAKQYEPMYISGLVAGRITKTNNMGFIAAHPVPQVLQNINAFALGARSVNAKVKIHVVWTNKWSDPATEAEAAKGLIDSGVDVLAMHLDSPITVAQTAEKNGIYTIGYHCNLHTFAPHGWLTGAMWNWGPLYLKMAQSVKNHTWKHGDYRYSMKEGYVQLSPFGAAVPKAVKDEALSLKKRIEQGQYTVFQGPLRDRDGKLLLSRGKMPDLSFIESMHWLAPGVEGTLSKN